MINKKYLKKTYVNYRKGNIFKKKPTIHLEKLENFSSNCECVWTYWTYPDANTAVVQSAVVVLFNDSRTILIFLVRYSYSIRMY